MLVPQTSTTSKPLEWQMSGDIVAGRHGKAQTLEEVPQEYAAFKIEQRARREAAQVPSA